MTDYIDRQAAIDLVKDVCDAVMSECEIWYDPEVKGEVYKDIREVNAILKCNKEVRTALRNMPSAHPEIIRCKDCKHYNAGFECLIEGYGIERNKNWYCADAERRTDECMDV